MKEKKKKRPLQMYLWQVVHTTATLISNTVHPLLLNGTYAHFKESVKIH